MKGKGELSNRGGRGYPLYIYSLLCVRLFSIPVVARSTWRSGAAGCFFLEALLLGARVGEGMSVIMAYLT